MRLISGGPLSSYSSLAEKSDFGQAGRIFQRVLDLQLIKLSNYVNLALALKMQGKLEQAVKVLGKGHELMLSLGRQAAAKELKLYISVLQSQNTQKSKASQTGQNLPPKTVTVSIGRQQKPLTNRPNGHGLP